MTAHMHADSARDALHASLSGTFPRSNTGYSRKGPLIFPEVSVSQNRRCKLNAANHPSKIYETFEYQDGESNLAS